MRKVSLFVRVALVHYWLLNRRGGEKVLEAICRLFPEADIFTLFYEPENVSPLIRTHKVRASYLNPLRKAYRRLLPLMPMALESFDLREYDLVISSESGPAKGVLTESTTPHICYCHTPMRYLWEHYPVTRAESPAFLRPFLDPLASYLRTWDFATAARVDHFIANSRNVKRRIRKTYRRKSRVVYPPVATQLFRNEAAEDYFLTVGELVHYKRFDYVIQHFANSGRKLKVVGDGPLYRDLRNKAKSNVEFCGRVSDEQLRSLYAKCVALIAPGEEDFGIATVEALASGKPVIALARGGSLEIVDSGCGVFYDQPAESALAEALRKFDQVAHCIEPSRTQLQAARFSESTFDEAFVSALREFRVLANAEFPLFAIPKSLEKARRRSA